MATVRGWGLVYPRNSAFHSCFRANKTWKNIIITIIMRAAIISFTKAFYDAQTAPLCSYYRDDYGV